MTNLKRVINMYIENIVIGKPLCEPSQLLAENDKDWEINEKDKTLFTEERFLPRILVDLGIYPSISEIRRNRSDLMITLNDIDFIDKLKVKKKQFLWIIVGS